MTRKRASPICGSGVVFDGAFFKYAKIQTNFAANEEKEFIRNQKENH